MIQGATRITLVLVGTITKTETGKMDHNTRFQMLMKDKAVNMTEDHKESNDKEQSKEQEATERKAAEEKEEHKEVREKKPKEVKEQSASAPKETTSDVEQPSDVSEGVKGDSKPEENIDVTKEAKVEKDEKHIVSQQETTTANIDMDANKLVPVDGTSHETMAVKVEGCSKDGEYFEEDYITDHELNVVHDMYGVRFKVESDYIDCQERYYRQRRMIDRSEERL